MCKLQSSWIVRINDFFNLLFFQVMISIIFVDNKLITYPKEAFVHGRVICMMESDLRPTDAAKAVID